MSFHISSKLLKYFKGFCSSPEIIMLFVYTQSEKEIATID